VPEPALVTNPVQARVEQLADALETGAVHQIRNLLEILNPADVADLLERSPLDTRMVLWNFLDSDRQSEILQYIDEDIVQDLLIDRPAEEVASILENIDSDDDLTDILQQLPDALTSRILDSMDQQNRIRVEHLLSYPEDTAGGLMDTDTISVRASVTLDVVLRYIRRHPELPPMTDNIFVVNSKDEYIGVLPISKLLVSDPNMTVREMMITEVEPIVVWLPEKEVVSIFERYDLVSAAVVDEDGRLLGRITIDDVVDVIIDEADHSILASVGLTEDDDFFAPILRTAKSRAFWLGANLITAFIASGVINLFEATISKVVALAVLMPIVASMGGVAGSQTLTLVIRANAQGQLMSSNERWLLMRELAVGAINGVIWATIVAVSASLVFQDHVLGLIIGTALIINLVVAALSGALLPKMLQSMGIDPAIAGTVVLTTITDVVGFMSFLGLATLFYA